MSKAIVGKTLLCLFVVLCLSYSLFGKTCQDETGLLLDGLLSVEAQFADQQLHAWGKLPLEAWSQQSQQAFLDFAMKELGIEQGTYNTTFKNSNHSLEAYAVHQGQDAFITVHIKQTALKEIFLVINWENTRNLPIPLDGIKTKIQDIFKNAGTSAHITTCFTGWLDGKLEQDDFAVKMQRVFQDLDAVMLDRLEQPNFMSYNGFSPALSEFVPADGKKTNVHVAIRYHPYDNRTYVTIGSPVITGEY